MAHPINFLPKYFVYVLLLAVFPFLWMIHFSFNEGNIHNREINSSFAETPNSASDMKQLPNREFSIMESLNETVTDDIIPTQESALLSRRLNIISHDVNIKDWWKAMLKRQTERKLHLRRMCETKYNQSILPLTEFVKDKRRLYSFYYIDKFKLLYSFVHKVGSSNWARLLRTATKSHKLKRLYRLPRREALSRLRNYTSFIIVRHPLVRLLSAYRDKFVEHHIPHYKSIGRKILKNFRKGVTKNELKRANDVRFEELLSYIVATRKHQGNTHWDHSMLRNKVCLFDYDIIAKLETGDEDTKFILKTFKMDGLVNLRTQYHNYTGQQDIVRSYYSKIPNKLLKRVVNAYESDFVLFNYSMSVP